jgi:hypothetical protein
MAATKACLSVSSLFTASVICLSIAATKLRVDFAVVMAAVNAGFAAAGTCPLSEPCRVAVLSASASTIASFKCRLSVRKYSAANALPAVVSVLLELIMSAMVRSVFAKTASAAFSTVK